MNCNSSSQKQEPNKGCLLLLAGIALCALGLYVGIWHDIPFVKYLSIMMGSLIGSFVGNVYFNHGKKKTPVWQWWVMLALIILISALLTVFLK